MENQIHLSHHQIQPATATQQKQPAAVMPNDALPPLFAARRIRRVYANGYRKTSPAWFHFNELSDEHEPTVACKYCHKKYRCDSKS
jgi:hypothetical protein